MVGRYDVSKCKWDQFSTTRRDLGYPLCMQPKMLRRDCVHVNVEVGAGIEASTLTGARAPISQICNEQASSVMAERPKGRTMSTRPRLNLDALVLLTSAYFSLGANRFGQGTFHPLLFSSPFPLNVDISRRSIFPTFEIQSCEQEDRQRITRSACGSFSVRKTNREAWKRVGVTKLVDEKRICSFTTRYVSKLYECSFCFVKFHRAVAQFDRVEYRAGARVLPRLCMH